MNKNLLRYVGLAVTGILGGMMLSMAQNVAEHMDTVGGTMLYIITVGVIMAGTILITPRRETAQAPAPAPAGKSLADRRTEMFNVLVDVLKSISVDTGGSVVQDDIETVVKSIVETRIQ